MSGTARSACFRPSGFTCQWGCLLERRGLHSEPVSRLPVSILRHKRLHIPVEIEVGILYAAESRALAGVGIQSSFRFAGGRNGLIARADQGIENGRHLWFERNVFRAGFCGLVGVHRTIAVTGWRGERDGCGFLFHGTGSSSAAFAAASFAACSSAIAWRSAASAASFSA